MSTTRRPWIVLAVLFTMTTGAMTAGCGGGGGGGAIQGPPPVPARGKVTYKGLPVEGATVSFLGDGKSRAAMAITDAGGDFLLTTVRSGDGAVPGIHKVTVTKIIGQPSAKANTGPMSMEDAVKASKEATAPKALSMLPEKYATAASSPLQFEVKSGDKNEFPIELTD